MTDRKQDQQIHVTRSSCHQLSRNIIHTTIRSSNNKSANYKNNSISKHNENNEQKSISSRKSTGYSMYSIKVTKIPRQHRSLSQLTSKSTSNKISPEHDENSLRQSKNETKCHIESNILKPPKITDYKINDNHQYITTTSDIEMDQFDNTKNYHKNFNRQKKKKKYSRLCIVLSILAIILIIIAIIIILIILLNKSNTNIKTTIGPSNVLLRWNSTGITVAGITGQTSSSSNHLKYPFGLTIDFNNTLYISDYQNNRIQKYFMGISTGLTVAGQFNGVAGSNSTYLNQPAGIIVDENDNLYVTDIGNARVQFFSKGTSSAMTIAGISGSPGNATNELNVPYGIALDENSNTIYIADTKNHRIMKYLSGATSGIVIAGNNGAGLSNIQLNQPTCVYFDSVSNSLVIANQFSHNIIRWELDANSWTLIAGSLNGSSGITSALLQYPVGMTLDPTGNVYVADTLNHRIQFFLTGQVNGSTIAGIVGIAGDNATLLNIPYSVALDNRLSLYVVDTYNQRVQKFFRY